LASNYQTANKLHFINNLKETAEKTRTNFDKQEQLNEALQNMGNQLFEIRKQ